MSWFTVKHLKIDVLQIVSKAPQISRMRKAQSYKPYRYQTGGGQLRKRILMFGLSFLFKIQNLVPNVKDCCTGQWSGMDN